MGTKRSKAAALASRGAMERVSQNVAIIRANWLALRHHPGRLPPGRSALGYLRTETYRLAREIARRKECEVARQFAMSQGREQAADEDERGPALFSWLLSGIVRGEMKRAELRHLTHELQYARMHKLPPELVVGFLLQARLGRSIYERIRRGETEGWYSAEWRAAELGHVDKG